MIRQRCAIYTRKSTEEGLEQSFNSLDAQREACSAYILSHNGTRVGRNSLTATTMAASPAGRWSARVCGGCLQMSARGGST